MIIKTHSGLFHADEVFAVALLLEVFKNKHATVIRSRDDSIDADLFIDIGGKFDNEKYFDHHFKGFDQYHKTGVPKSSFGLIYDKFGPLLIMDSRVFEKVKYMIVVPIDGHDNGMRSCKGNEYNYSSFSISNAISSFNKLNDKNDIQFFKAVEFATQILLNVISNAQDQINEEEEVIPIFEKYLAQNSNYVIFDRYRIYINVIKNERYSNFKHIIFPENNQWRAVCIKNDNRELKAPFPESWGGLTGEELVKVSGISGSQFCHRGLFIAVNDTLEGILEMINACYA